MKGRILLIGMILLMQFALFNSVYAQFSGNDFYALFQGSVCNGDGICNPEDGEDYMQCPEECFCGDTVCDEAEFVDDSCPGDCDQAVCGDGICQVGEEDFCFEDCGCPAGFTECSPGECYDLMNDPSNCGECGFPCASDEECVDGICELITCTDECPPNSYQCEGAAYSIYCGNFDTDPCYEWGPLEPCASGESCSPETGQCEPSGYCGDGICNLESGETFSNCPEDCPAVCGDGLCDNEYGEDSLICYQDCAGYCGDSLCNPAENSVECPSDCTCNDDMACDSLCMEAYGPYPEAYSMCYEECVYGSKDPQQSCSMGYDECVLFYDQQSCQAGLDSCRYNALEACSSACNNNGVCDYPEEDSGNCPGDCFCGDSICDSYESTVSCPEDCETSVCNDNGMCEYWDGEDSGNCPSDCYCGDNYCEPEEEGWCEKDCGSQACNYDGICNYPEEDQYSCPNDCYCGDGICEENEEWCEEDCGVRENHLAVCWDSLDNDEDLLTDCDDPDCRESCLLYDIYCVLNGTCEMKADEICSKCGDQICDDSETITSCVWDCDLLAPTTSVDGSLEGGIPYTFGEWTNAAVTIESSAVDNPIDGSGVRATVYCSSATGECVPYRLYKEPAILPRGVRYFCYRSVDNAYNVEDTLCVQVRVDDVPPVTTPIAEDVFGNIYNYEDWVSVINLDLDCEDDRSGCETTYYCSGETTCNPITEYTGTLLFNGDGEPFIYFYSVDSAGNVEEDGFVQLHIDATPPETVFDAVKADSLEPYTPGTWSNEDLLVSLDCQDAVSGCNETYYCSSLGGECVPDTIYQGNQITVSENNSYLCVYSTDNAGNQADAVCAEFKVDRVPPVEEITFSASSTDACSGRLIYNDVLYQDESIVIPTGSTIEVAGCLTFDTTVTDPQPGSGIDIVTTEIYSSTNRLITSWTGQDSREVDFANIESQLIDGESYIVTLEKTGTDLAGNSETTTIAISLDEDDDGVPNSLDRCWGTEFDVLNETLRPNHYAYFENGIYFQTNEGSTANPLIVDSTITITDAFGCSCKQILYCKPGNNKGEQKFGCTIGTMDNWTTQTGWAPDCQDNGRVVREGEQKDELENTDQDMDGVVDSLDTDDDADGIEDSEDSEKESRAPEPGKQGKGKPDWWCNKHPGKC